RSGIVPFIDHAGSLTDLQAWCNSDERISVRLVVGPGGTGKTRLGLELCRHMVRRGLLAGVYRDAGPSGLTALAREPIHRLIVIDYADLQPDIVREVVAAMLDRLPSRSARVRILLLLRRRGPTGDPRRWFTGPADRTTQLIDAATVQTANASNISTEGPAP